jgi:methylated-DNA-protein-cysteine methyltransferase-like protein
MVASNRHTRAVQQIIQVLVSIPAGRVASYGQVADLAGLPGRARLVGKVLREAADEFNLPWHRIVQASGRLAFKAGSRQAKKQTIRLTEEGVVVSANRVSIKDFGWQPSLADMLFQFTG